MKKMMMLGAAAAVALVPATLGLTANPSLSAKVPVPSIQVPLTTVATTHDAGDDQGGDRVERTSDDTVKTVKVTDGAHRNRHSGDDDATKTTKKTTARKSGGSDDPANHDAGDDKSATTKSGGSDDPASHDAGDDKGGKSGSGKGGGSDDGSGHDAGDDNGGHHGNDD